ncbi:glycoside hydrolase domain-containing protein [Herpetosiphon geysericola]|uniref:glycoside hydrolase domain-containing protein n=1 Tax=Herpetosiphon geysericola TaxID=70996 RepID=UPI0006C8FEFA|nr:glycoside hydrolase domain-containing protein [Herpetosiphon geysericola]
MDARFRYSSLLLILVFVFGGALVMLSPRQALASSHSETRLSGQYESNNGGTTIWLRLCGAGAKYRFRSVRVADGAVLWDRTYDTINGCLPFSYRAIIGARTGEQFRFYTMVLDAPISDAEFLKRARRDFCRVDNGAAGTITCQRESVSSPGSDINEPSNNQTLHDAITVRGWYLDLAATENSGISEVHVHLIDGSSDRFIGAATYGISRPDVAAAYGDTRFTNSGYSLSFDTRNYPNGTYTLRVDGHSIMSGAWSSNARTVTIANAVNQPPNPPSLSAPANGATLASRTITLGWQDAGDPDNGPRSYRDYSGEVWNTDRSWGATINWQTATSASVTVPADGAYSWHMRSGDGGASSSWSSTWNFTVSTQASAHHDDTRLRGAAEWSGTTIFLQVCGGGPNYRFRSESITSGQVLWDYTYGSLNGCSPDYRAVITAAPGEKFRFYSTVMNSPLADADFLARARRDSCIVESRGIIRCQQGDTPPEPVAHTDTRLRGAAENNRTTVFLTICGQGPNYRFRSEAIGSGAVLWDQTYGAINGCSPNYRAVVNAVPGETFRFYSTVMSGSLSDSDFLARARRDSCRIDSGGVIRCRPGNTPPDPIGGSGGNHTVLSQRQGFDACTAPSLSMMQTWVNSSPYRNIGIYIGGSARACHQNNLTRDWVAATSQQGWTFIPIWVGPQAPCTGFGSRISSDVATARNQGTQEADAAISAAGGLGLTDADNAQSIIYYDMEAYNTNDSGCRAAVKAFLDGWVSQLHSRNNKAGIYGSACGTAANDWASLANVPDVAWIAAWYRSSYDSGASVYGLPCVPDGNWSNHRRIRQYAGGHRETWGGVTINIDSNAVDGLVATGIAQSIATNLSTADAVDTDASAGLNTTTASLSIQAMNLVLPGQGWVLRSQRLLWTADTGASWRDITPVLADGVDIQSVFFRDADHGWMVAVRTADGGAEVVCFRTADGGASWQVSTLAAFTQADGVAPPSMSYLDFIDSTTGGIVIKSASGVNFSQGQLFKTTDGGATWSQHNVPIGAPVRFSSASDGWLVGGPAGDQAYVTRDGGLTWIAQAIGAEAGTGEVRSYMLPTFTDTQHGAFPVIRGDADQSRVELYRTTDAGATWLLDETRDLQVGIEVGATVPVAVADIDHWVVGGPSAGSTLPSDVVELKFANADQGWARTNSGSCSNQTVCSFTTSLFQTSDGGQTWSVLNTPRNDIYLPLLQR